MSKRELKRIECCSWKHWDRIKEINSLFKILLKKKELTLLEAADFIIVNHKKNLKLLIQYVIIILSNNFFRRMTCILQILIELRQSNLNITSYFKASWKKGRRRILIGIVLENINEMERAILIIRYICRRKVSRNK